ncbi:MAG: hypothetical protein IJK46_07145 [Prevotella sp.]|nr:hypothetical protein [Prevotella sp.]
MNLKYLFAAVAIFMVAGCESASRFRMENKARTAADSFATYFFNWQFDKAAHFATDSSMIWLRYAASQVHKADIDLLRVKEDAVINIDEIFINDENTASARITVRDFIRMDTIGTEGHIVEKASFVLQMERNAEKEEDWKIRMEGLPQSEKRNRD